MRSHPLRAARLVPTLPLLLLAATLSTCAAPSGPAASKRPNVLFIAVDDLRPELGCYGARHIRTPNIDRLAASGVLFTRAYCQSAVCNPSRASLMTGLRPDTLRVWDLSTDFRRTTPDAVTLPQRFMAGGYHTAAIGKIYHNTIPDPASWSEPKLHADGFPFDPDAVYAGEEELAWLEQRKQQIVAAGREERHVDRLGEWYLKAAATEAPDVPDSAYFDGVQTELALEKLAELSGGQNPFFLAVGYYRPHLPFNAPKRYWDLYQRDQLPLPEHRELTEGAPLMAINTMRELRGYRDFREVPRPDQSELPEEEMRRLRHGYYASVSYVDAQIGRLLDELERLGLAENTIVVLWGDHGWKLGEHRSWCKMTNYEIDARVPLIVAAPGARGNGGPCEGLVELVDVYPTLCELAGLEAPAELEGTSFAPLLEDRARPGKDAVFCQFLRQGIWTAPDGVEYMGYGIRTERYRYVEWRSWATGELSARELYDQRADPGETLNLAERPELEATLGELARRLAAQRGGGESASALLQRARAALGTDGAGATVRLSGRTARHGLPAEFSWILSPEGLFRRELRGPFPESTGYDGRTAWRVDGRSPSYPLVLLARERLLASAGLVSGAWCREGSAFEAELAGAPEPGTRALRLRLEGGLLSGTLVLDEPGLLPREFRFDEEFGGGAVRFEGWRAERVPPLPRRITFAPAQGEPMVLEVDDALPWEGGPPDFGPPPRAARDERFDAEAPPELEVRRAASGHLFVRPRIDGREPGWFLFDSGLGGSVLTRSAADELALASLGETFVGGFGGPPARAVFRRAQTLELGPLTIEDPVFIEQESLGMAERMLGGERCAGALGWDVFLRAIVEVDPQVGRVRLFDPRAFEEPAARWQELALHWQVPYVRARFEGDREGWFCIDTGAGELTALFHHSAASRLGLLDGLEGDATPARGARGAFARRPRELAWFELAGRRHAPATVQLSVAEDGEADPYALGFVGSGFLGDQRLLFDYGRSRVGFLPPD